MPDLIVVSSHQRRGQQEEVHRRRIAEWTVTRDSQYGLRGVRIGEASNPGPPGNRIRPDGVSEAVLESLERALTVLGTSDDGFLVRAVTGRHVVRRVEQSTRVWFDEIGFFQ